MTRSIFDPSNPHVERSGNTFLGETADNRSHMPEEATDGIVHDEVETAEGDAAARNPEDAIGEHPVLPGVEQIDQDKTRP